MGTEPLVKGSAIREFAHWYEGRFGRDYVRGVVERLGPAMRDQLFVDRQALGIVATEWYPSEIVHAILDAVSEGKSDDEMGRLVREATEFTVRRLSRGLYKLLFRMVGSPGLYAKHVQRAWSSLHTTGTRRVVIGDSEAESIIEDWPGHHRWLCLVTMETMRSVFEIMGCRDVQLERLSCVHDGADRCRARLRYAEPR